jgi:DMSO/TMAO reductase YedYZ molybdopterin-dependent catalytic subunit
MPMKRLYRTSVTVFAVLILAALAGCSQQGESTVRRQGPMELGDPGGVRSAVDAYPVVDGLHVTGQPVDIDIQTYRLRISGSVDKPLSLSYEQIRGMEAERERIRLVCPGFFTDEGFWTGVRIGDLLALAGIREGARKVSFISTDGGYRADIDLDDALGEGMLIAYAFDDKPLARVHGYPLRVVAKDQPGNRWVKWLGEIIVK